MSRLRYPAIPTDLVRPDDIGGLNRVFAAIRERLEIFSRDRGRIEDSAVTVADLLALGLVAPAQVQRDRLFPAGVLAPAAGATPAGDPWNYEPLEADFTVSVTANTAVPGLSFTPEANKRYMIEGQYLLRTAVTTTGPRPGNLWPTGYTDGSASTFVPNSNTASAQRWQQAGTTANAASTGLPSNSASFLGTMQALLIMGASPSGNFQVTLASEIAASAVTMRAGSFIRWREY